MHVVTSRPAAIHVGLADRGSQVATNRPTFRTAVDLVARGFLVGEAIGMFAMTEGRGFLSVTVTGIVAIGIALVSWDR